MKGAKIRVWIAAAIISLLLTADAASMLSAPPRVGGRSVTLAAARPQKANLMESAPDPGQAAQTATADEPAWKPHAQAATSRPTSASKAVETASAPTVVHAVSSDSRKEPKYWPEWPLIPDVSAQAKAIYARGLEMGNDPHSFTTVGDCQSEPAVFMGIYDSDHYVLGEGYEYLEESIRHFKGSFQRDSVTVQNGLSVASALSPAWADPEKCEKGETPLECEIRRHRPVIAFVNLGTNWNGGDDIKHEMYMRQVVDVLIENGVVPVISTKGDNLEGDHRLNRSMARVAYDYELPLWNFWRSIRDLPGKGIDGGRPGGYLTPQAWGRRSFTGLQVLDSVWRTLSE